MSRPLRCLTLHQPWATAIIDGPKRVENRTWGLPRRWFVRPVHIAIHAGLTFTGEAMEMVSELWPEAPRGPERYPRGAVLGVVRVYETVFLEEDRSHRVALDPWAVGPVCWSLGEVWRCRVPVPCKGRQGLWTLPDPVAAEVRRQAVRVDEPAPASTLGENLPSPELPRLGCPHCEHPLHPADEVDAEGQGLWHLGEVRTCPECGWTSWVDVDDGSPGDAEAYVKAGD